MKVLHLAERKCFDETFAAEGKSHPYTMAVLDKIIKAFEDG